MTKTTAMFLLFSTLFLSSTLLSEGAPILDTAGNPLLTGTPYHILPALRGAGGGLGLARMNNTCPLYVSQAIPELDIGLPVTFFPIKTAAKTVELSTDTNLVFSGKTVCVDSMGWRLRTVDGTTYVSMGGIVGNPGVSTLSYWFRIERYGRGKYYKIAYCPTVCTCKPLCGDLGVLHKDGRRRLVLKGGSPFPVMFKKP